MKIDRHIGILSVLLQKDQVTAPYLAEVRALQSRKMENFYFRQIIRTKKI